jgi:ADP-L-glycero-D-manno-heptose 6-epimerase
MAQLNDSPYIVITGAAGMIGSALVRHLNDQGRSNLILVDDLKVGDKWKNLVGKSFVRLISRHNLLAWLQGRAQDIEAVIHLGACSDTTEKDGDYLLKNNVDYTIELAKWAVQHHIRFIYASSAATYGDGNQGFVDDERALIKLMPLNLYGYSKHMVDLFLQREGLLPYVVGLKYFNVFGPNEYHKRHMASMILKMTSIARQDKKISLFKSNDPLRFRDGEQVRDMIYVKDAVKMTAAFLDPPYCHLGGIYNIGRGQPVTWNHLARALVRGLEGTVEIEYVEMPPELSKQYQNYTCADMNKFYSVFPSQLAPSFTPDDAISDYLTYLLTGQRW